MQDIIDEYKPKFCEALELAYGKGLMSEGGEEALKCFFKDFSLSGKKVLDLGCGLGGAAEYLARDQGAFVTGLEVNPWMIKEATRRIPKGLEDKLNYVLSTSNESLSFDSKSFDFIYSKGVLCHLEDKKSLFAELQRLLKPGVTFLINDWLSFEKGQWGPSLERMIELDGLSLYAETLNSYTEALEMAGFDLLSSLDQTSRYASYNEDIVSTLETKPVKDDFLTRFGQDHYMEALEGYSAIARAMREQEVRVLVLKVEKKKGLKGQK